MRFDGCGWIQLYGNSESFGLQVFPSSFAHILTPPSDLQFVYGPGAYRPFVDFPRPANVTRPFFTPGNDLFDYKAECSDPADEYTCWRVSFDHDYRVADADDTEAVAFDYDFWCGGAGSVWGKADRKYGGGAYGVVLGCGCYRWWDALRF